MSLILNPGEQLLVVSNAAATTTELLARVSYADTADSTVGANSVSTSGTTPVTVTAAPSGSPRVISGLNVLNLDTVPHQIEVATGSGGSIVAPVFNATLNPGDSLQFTAAHAWCVFNAYGVPTGLPGPVGPPGANGVVEVPPVNAQTGTAYTLQASDAPAASGYYGVVTMNNAAANAVTVPPGIFPVGARVIVVQLGTGATSLSPGAGVTLEGSTSIGTQYGSLTLVQTALNTWIAPPAGATGTVTSVGLTLPGQFSVSGSPVTGSGTLTAAWQPQTANLIFAGPSSGGASAPTFRALGTSDFPASGVTAGSYTLASITVDDTGRITAASTGSAGGVTSFNTRTGAVVPASGDYTFAQIGSTPTTLAGYGITDTLTNSVAGLSGVVTAAALQSALGLGTAAYTASTAYATAAQGALAASALQPDADGQVPQTARDRKVNALGNITGSVNIDLSSGGVITGTMTGNCTFAFTNPPSSGYVRDVELRLTQDATGSRIATWPANGAWPGASAFVLTTAANAEDVIGFSVDSGSNWIGYPVEDVG